MWNSALKHTRVKFCEFESLDAAYEAACMGADALGFHIFNHQDVQERIARFSTILPVLPPQVEPVLLSDLDFETMVYVANELRFPTVQLYPDWEPHVLKEFRRRLPSVRILKVVSAIPKENSPADHSSFIRAYDPVADGYLLDSYRNGGTGKTADWEVCAKFVRLAGRPVLLAGGLTQQNVGEAIRVVKPWGVDVETGVSTRLPDGRLIKNMAKCREFLSVVSQQMRLL
jgi:phosphoribosylanthranilate isomerase